MKTSYKEHTKDWYRMYVSWQKEGNGPDKIEKWLTPSEKIVFIEHDKTPEGWTWKAYPVR